MPVYLDCAATTPVDPRVQEVVLRYLAEEFGNAGSRTHEYGLRARKAVERARAQVAAVVESGRGDVVFTSGATESNNLAILGLADYGERSGRRHVISTQIEHHAVLEPIQQLARRGFEFTLLPSTAGGWVETEALREALREDTLLVSVMQVNNETGIRQPLGGLADVLRGHPAYFHVDAAQGYGKDLPPLRDPRIDLISVSGHKIHAPKGVGALIARRRGSERPPLAPRMYGGGQERGLRPGTLPVHLIAGLGKAAEIAAGAAPAWDAQAGAFKSRLLSALAPLQPRTNGDPDRCVSWMVNLSFPGFDAECVIEAWSDLVAISDGAACTSQSATCSHVLAAMRLPAERIEGAVRLSWHAGTELPQPERLVRALRDAR